MAVLLSLEPWTIGAVTVDVNNSPKWDRQIVGRKSQCINGGIIIQRRLAWPRTVQLEILVGKGDHRSERNTLWAALEDQWATAAGSLACTGPGVTFNAFIDPDVHWSENWLAGHRFITIGLILSGGITHV